jgi:hypothetical protein
VADFLAGPLDCGLVLWLWISDNRIRPLCHEAMGGTDDSRSRGMLKQELVIERVLPVSVRD